MSKRRSPRPPPPRPPSPRTALCSAEIIQQRRCFQVAKIKKDQNVGSAPNISLVDLPSAVDWAAMQRTPLVRNQGLLCASSWALAAVAAIESTIAIVYNTAPIEVSAQIMVSCANEANAGVNFNDSVGCQGGSALDALHFASQYTIPLEAAYPYTSGATGQSGTCQTQFMNLPWSYGDWVQGFGVNRYQPGGSELYLSAAVAIQPIIIYWNIGANWFAYSGGVYSVAQQTQRPDGCSDNLDTVNHAMLLVGYGNETTSNGTHTIFFWTIQNSFGTSWGVQGLAYVEMTGTPRGPCGMYGYTIAPVMSFRHVPPSVKVVNASGLVWRQFRDPLVIRDHICSDFVKCVLKTNGVLDKCCQISSVAISPDGLVVAAGAWDYTVRVWSVTTHVLLATLTGHTDWVTSVAFSADGATLASGSADATVRLWDVGSRTVTQVLVGHTATVNCLAFSPNGRLLASGAGDSFSARPDKSVRLWEMASVGDAAAGNSGANSSQSGGLPAAAWLATLVGHSREVRGVAFSSDSATLVTASADSTIRVWNATPPFLPASDNLPAHFGVVTGVAISPDGQLMVSSGFDYTVRLWNISDIHRPAQLGWFHGNQSRLDAAYTYISNRRPLLNGTSHTDAVTSVAFSPDGARIVSGSYDKTMRVWETRTLQPVATLADFVGTVTSVAYANDGHTLAGGSYEGFLRLFTLQVPQRDLAVRASRA